MGYIGERKVLNRYFPPEFSRKKRVMRSILRGSKVRMMLPFNVRCRSCSSFLYKGTKFTMAMTQQRCVLNFVPTERIFSFRCYKCTNEIVFKTESEDIEYSIVSGAFRIVDAKNLY